MVSCTQVVVVAHHLCVGDKLFLFFPLRKKRTKDAVDYICIGIHLSTKTVEARVGLQ